MVVVSFVLALGGLAVAVVGYLGLVGRLPRNGLAGVRTPATMRGDAAFKAANKAAGPLTLLGGVVGVLAAPAAWLAPGDGAALAVVLVAVVVMSALVVAGAVLGIRAARSAPAGE